MYICRPYTELLLGPWSPHSRPWRQLQSGHPSAASRYVVCLSVLWTISDCQSWSFITGHYLSIRWQMYLLGLSLMLTILIILYCYTHSMHSSAKLQSPPLSVLFFCLCDKAYLGKLLFVCVIDLSWLREFGSVVKHLTANPGIMS